jgi:hypothetical protein
MNGAPEMNNNASNLAGEPLKTLRTAHRKHQINDRLLNPAAT